MEEPSGATEMALFVSMNILLGITGSVSAYKTPWLVRDLVQAGHSVRVVMTPSARKFVAPLALEAVSKNTVIIDPFETSVQAGGSWHVHLAQWAELMLIAPCSATTLSRLATGLCETSLMMVVASRPPATPLIVAPAMDTDMWNQPAVQRNVEQIKADGVEIINPESGELASGLVGVGRLPDIAKIIELVLSPRMQGPSHSPQPGNSLRGKRFVVTAGPTHEPIDSVRSIVNHSTGTMGFALAASAQERGALVTLIAGPVSLPTPYGVERIDVATAAQMYDAVIQHLDADVFVMSAAVADFTPLAPVVGKIKKSQMPSANVTLDLAPTKDILSAVCATKQSHQLVVGFALEHTNLIEYATQKLQSKKADMIVANLVAEQDSGFGTGNNTITIITPNKPPTEYPPMPKRACAEIILDAVENL